MPLPPMKPPEKLLLEIYKDLLQGATRKFGDALAVIADRILAGVAKSQEEQELDRLHGDESSESRRRLAAEAIDRVPPERRVFPAAQIVGPIFRGSEFELPGTPIWEMWSELLSRACDRDRVAEAHPSYPMLIQQISPDEALVLSRASEMGSTGILPVMVRYERHQRAETHRLFDEGVHPPVTFEDQVEIYIRRLSRLGLLEQKEVGDRSPIFGGNALRQTHYRVKESVFITEEGKAFVKAISSPGSEPHS